MVKPRLLPLLCACLCASLFVNLLTASSLTAQDNPNKPSVQADVVYGHKMGMALTMDVVKPAKPNGAAVLFMVSGGWVSSWFDVAQAIETPGGFLGPFRELTDHGFTVAFVRHGSSPMFKVPDAVADVRRAVRYVRAHAGDLGIDPQRIGVFGGSAGGHLSLMLGNASDDGDASSKDPIERVSDRVAAVVAYFPPVDLRTIVGPSDRFPALDFAVDKAADVSPLLFVSPDDPPTLLVHGDADTLVPLDNSHKILAAFLEQKVKSELIVIEGGGHGFRGEHQAKAGEALVRWFDQYLNPGATAPTSQ